MKQIFKHTLVCLSMLSALCALAWSPSYTISVIKVAINEEPDKLKELDRRHRIPSAPIECVIISDGVQLMSSSVAVSDIISFEIWDAESEYCIGDYSNESDFTNALFSMPSGEYQICLITDDYELVGYIAL